MANPDASSAKNTQVVISVKEGVIGFDGQCFGGVGKTDFINPDVVNNILEFAAPIVRTGNTTLGHVYATQADIKGPAPLAAPTDKAGMRMLGENELENAPAELLELRCVGLDYHAIAGWCRAGGWQSAHFLNLNNAEPTAPERGKVRMST